MTAVDILTQLDTAGHSWKRRQPAHGVRQLIVLLAAGGKQQTCSSFKSQGFLKFVIVLFLGQVSRRSLFRALWITFILGSFFPELLWFYNKQTFKLLWAQWSLWTLVEWVRTGDWRYLVTCCLVPLLGNNCCSFLSFPSLILITRMSVFLSSGGKGGRCAKWRH